MSDMYTSDGRKRHSFGTQYALVFLSVVMSVTRPWWTPRMPEMSVTEEAHGRKILKLKILIKILKQFD